MSSLRDQLVKLKEKGGVLSQYVEEALDKEQVKSRKMAARRMGDEARTQVLEYERELRELFEKGQPGKVPFSDLELRPSTMVETPYGSGYIRGCLKDSTGGEERVICLVILDTGISVAMIPGTTSHHAVLAAHQVTLRKVRRPGA